MKKALILKNILRFTGLLLSIALLIILLGINSLNKGDLATTGFNKDVLLNDFGKKIAGKIVFSKKSKKYSLPWCATGDRSRVENLGILSGVGEAEALSFTKAKNCFKEMAQ